MTRRSGYTHPVIARAVPIAARPALAAALDRRRNSALCEGIAAMEIFLAADDGTLLTVDRNRVARLSDPSTVAGAIWWRS